MKLSVIQLARASGVTVRTLHFYDEVGLLKPAYYGTNGYRFYEEKQVLQLQQILFFRELGFELKQIQRLLSRADFDRAAALKAHRKVLEAQMERTRQLIITIDNTLAQMKGKKKMKTAELFRGFDQKKQAEYEQQLIARFGEGARKTIAESRKKVQHWTRADWEQSGKEWDAICRELVAAMERKLQPASQQVQQIVARHFEWLKQFWTPNRESYNGHGQFIAESELRQAYDKYDPQLAEYLGRGIKVFAETQLA